MPTDPLYSDTEWLDSAQAATLVVVLDEYREYRLRSTGHRITVFHPVSRSSGLRVS